MTEEYARLSIRAGFLVGVIESELGNTGEVQAGVRKMAWKLTPELLETMKEIAIKQGARPEVLEQAEREAAVLVEDRKLVEHIMEFQAVVDIKEGEAS